MMKWKEKENDLKNILRCGPSDVLWKMTQGFLQEANRYNRLSSIEDVIFNYNEDSVRTYLKHSRWSTDDHTMHLLKGNKVGIVVPLLSNYINKSHTRETKIDKLFSYFFLADILIKKWDMNDDELPNIVRAAKKNHRNTIFDSVIDLDDDTRENILVDPELYLRLVDENTRNKIRINHIL